MPSVAPTTLSALQNPVVYGQMAQFTAAVTPPPGSGTPTGNVTLYDGATSLATATLDAFGQATFSTSQLPVGSHSLTATFSGDINFTSTTSDPLSETVGKASTTSTVSSFLNPSTFGQSVMFTATISVTSPGMGFPTGTVTFMDGANTLGTGTVSAGTASFTTSALNAGGHTITAVYDGDSNFQGTTSSNLAQNVSAAATTTTLTSSLNPSDYGQSVTFTATVMSTSGTPNGDVTFLDGANTLGTASLANGLATFSTAALAAGVHSISAVYASSGNYAGSTGTVSQAVNAVNHAPTLTLIGVPGAPVNEGSPISFTASASDTDVPAQMLTFSLSGTAPMGASIDPTTGAFTWTPTEAQGPATYAFSVRVTDSGTPSMYTEQAVTITVNEANEAPTLGAYTFAVAENSLSATLVGAMTGSDADLPTQTLSYAIVSGNAGGAFAINPASGQITVANSAMLDYEATPTFSLVVQAHGTAKPQIEKPDLSNIEV